MSDRLSSSVSADAATISACAAAFNGAIQVLVAVLEDAGVITEGAFSEGIQQFITLASIDADPLTIALLEEVSRSPRDPTN